MTGPTGYAARAGNRRPHIIDRRGLQQRTQEIPLDDIEVSGRVRWFSQEKGYGFIAPDDGGEDVFVRYSSIEADGFRCLNGGQRVVFERSDDGRGPRALQVRPTG